MDALDPIFPALIRGARSLLGWSQHELAEKSLLSVPSISRFERADAVGRHGNVLKLIKTLNEAGILFDLESNEISLRLTPDCAKRLRRETRAKQTS